MVLSKSKTKEIPLNILGYQDKDKEWIALALEMDLRGYGKTFDKALAELEGLIVEQIKFAIYKKDFSLLQHRAEDSYFRMFRETKEQSFRNYMEDIMGVIKGKASKRSKEKAVVCSFQPPAPNVLMKEAIQFN